MGPPPGLAVWLASTLVTGCLLNKPLVPMFSNRPSAAAWQNHWTYWAGVGIFHSGVEVHGVEYAYGGHEYDGEPVDVARV